MTHSLECNNCDTRFLVDDQSENQCPACGIGIGLPPISLESAEALARHEELRRAGDEVEMPLRRAVMPEKVEPPAPKPIDTGGTAFPRAASFFSEADMPVSTFDNGETGMTMRDWFAAHAPSMPVSVWGSTDLNLHTDADRAAYLAVVSMWNYEYADQMIYARKEKPNDATPEF